MKSANLINSSVGTLGVYLSLILFLGASKPAPLRYVRIESNNICDQDGSWNFANIYIYIYIFFFKKMTSL